MELESFQMEEIEEGLFLICIYRQGWQEVFVSCRRKEHAMKQSLNRHSSMFLMEIIIAILFFFLVSAFCLRIFTASRQMGQDTNDLNMAVNQSENIAGLLAYTLKSPDSSSMDMKGISSFCL